MDTYPNLARKKTSFCCPPALVRALISSLAFHLLKDLSLAKQGINHQNTPPSIFLFLNGLLALPLFRRADALDNQEIKKKHITALQEDKELQPFLLTYLLASQTQNAAKDNMN